MNKRKVFGIVGRNISYSFSPEYFGKKFFNENIDADYLIYDIQSLDELQQLLKSTPELAGFNVTIPYKSEIINLLHEIDPVAKEVGAVNTVKITPSGIKGFNTDVIGFMESLSPLIKNRIGISALILGTGGASKAVAYVLNKMSISFKFVSRTKKDICLTYDEIDKTIIESFELIINATPLGMYPNTDDCALLPYQYLNKNHILFDLIYNPEETLFLKKGREEGAGTKNGLEMLHIQAEAAWKIWNNKS